MDEPMVRGMEDLGRRGRQAEVGTVCGLLEGIEAKSLSSVSHSGQRAVMKIVLLKMQGYS